MFDFERKAAEKKMIMWCGEVCWVALLTRWASTLPYTACGQIPGVPWNWHFVWIAEGGGLVDGCEVFCLSFHLLFKLGILEGILINFGPASAFDFWKEVWVFPQWTSTLSPNLCLSTWLLTLFPRVLPGRPVFPNSGSILAVCSFSLCAPHPPIEVGSSQAQGSKKLFVLF